jgi:hypothetical protein
MILCDFQDDDSGTERCKSKATRFLLRCIHPPSPNYNQQGGEHGSYLGPESGPNHFSYDPKDVSSDNTSLDSHNHEWYRQVRLLAGLLLTITMTGETEEELLANAKKHGIEVHGYSEEKWNEDISKNKDHFRSLTKKM